MKNQTIRTDSIGNKSNQNRSGTMKLKAHLCLRFSICRISRSVYMGPFEFDDLLCPSRVQFNILHTYILFSAKKFHQSHLYLFLAWRTILETNYFFYRVPFYSSHTNRVMETIWKDAVRTYKSISYYLCYNLYNLQYFIYLLLQAFVETVNFKIIALETLKYFSNMKVNRTLLEIIIYNIPGRKYPRYILLIF